MSAYREQLKQRGARPGCGRDCTSYVRVTLAIVHWAYGGSAEGPADEIQRLMRLPREGGCARRWKHAGGAGGRSAPGGAHTWFGNNLVGLVVGLPDHHQFFAHQEGHVALAVR